MALSFEKIGRLAGETLVQQGHHRVAFLSPHFSAVTERYLKGLRSVLQNPGVDVDEKSVWWGKCTSPSYEENEVTDALDLILSRPDRPTTIIVTFDPLAELVCLHLASKGIRVPDEISVIGFGGTWRETPMMRRLTSVVVDEATTASRAVELLTEMSEGSRPLNDDEQFELPLAVSKGETVGPLSK